MINFISNTHQYMFYQGEQITFGESVDLDESLLTKRELESLVIKKTLGDILITAGDFNKIESALAAKSGGSGGGVAGVSSVNGLSGAVVLTKDDLGLDLGLPNGIATLDSAGLIPSAQLPSYVDDILEFANLAGFPVTGQSGIIYLAQDTNKIYRWSGSSYVNIAVGSGVADSAVKLQTARTIGGVSFDGTANISLPGVNIAGTQNTTGSAAKWTTARTLTFTGGATGSVSIDGSANASAALTVDLSSRLSATDPKITEWDTAVSNSHTHANKTVLDATTASYTTAEQTKLSGIATSANNYSHPTSGVTANTYRSVTVNAQGHVTAGTNPTTISGYGLTDVYTKAEVDSLLAAKVIPTFIQITQAEYDLLTEPEKTDTTKFYIIVG